MNEALRAERRERMNKYWADVKAGKRPAPNHVKTKEMEEKLPAVGVGGEVRAPLLRLQERLTEAWGFKPTLTQTLLFALNEAMQ